MIVEADQEEEVANIILVSGHVRGIIDYWCLGKREHGGLLVLVHSWAGWCESFCSLIWIQLINK